MKNFPGRLLSVMASLAPVAPEVADVNATRVLVCDQDVLKSIR